MAPRQMTIERRRMFRGVFFLVVLTAVIAEIIVDPGSLTSDGMSYLDIGDAILGLKSYAIVGYFSPLFSVWVALVVRLVHPSMANEFLVVRAACGVITIGAAFTLDLLVGEVLAYVKRRTAGGVELREEWWYVLGYSAFIWSAFRNVDAVRCTPDMGVMALLFAAMALIIRSWTRADRVPSLRDAAMLGAILGVGYLTKSVFFVYSLMLLSIFAFQARRSPRVFLAAWAVFAIGAATWIVPLSVAKGRPTFGDAGRLNIIWFEMPIRGPLHWQGDEPGFGTPAHPTNRLMRAPEVFEFAAPFPVSYGPWYDASYWYEGVRLHLDPRRVVTQSWQSFKGTSPQLWLLVVSFIGILIVSRTVAPVRELGGPLMVLALPALAAYAMYTPIAPEPRYLAPFVVTLYLFVFAAWGSWNGGARLRRLEMLMPAVAAVLLFSAGRVIVRHARATVDSGWAVHRMDDGDIRAAEALRAAGYREGTPMAGIGSLGAYTVWLRLGRFREVIESPNGETGSFWSSDSVTRAQIIGLFQHAGAHAVVSDSVPRGALPPGWRRVDGSQYAFCALPPVARCD